MTMKHKILMKKYVWIKNFYFAIYIICNRILFLSEKHGPEAMINLALAAFLLYSARIIFISHFLHLTKNAK